MTLAPAARHPACGPLPLLLLGITALLPAQAGAGSVFVQENLVSDGIVPAQSTDANLINPWGLDSGPNTPLWVANQVTSTATVYDGQGRAFPAGSPIVVRVPSSPGDTGPTGVAFNPTNSFNLASDGKSGKGLFFFANLDGSISGWNSSGDATRATQVVAPQAGTVYTGMAIASSGGRDVILAANNATGKIDAYDSNYQKTTLAGDFTDPSVPAGLAPFNVRQVGGRVFVTYAVPGEGNDEAPVGRGAVAEFTADGRLVRHIASGGQLTTPWGVTIAPQGFGDLAGKLLVGNFSEDHGLINAFDPNTGAFLGSLIDRNGRAIVNPYLWGITFGNGGNGGPADTLFLVAGLGDEQHGLLASISSAGATAVPLPAGLLAGSVGLGLTALVSRRARRRGKGG